QKISDADHVSAVDMHHTLWLPCRSGRIEDEERIFAVHVLRGTLRRELHQVVEIDLARTGRFELDAVTREHNNLLDEVETIDRLVNNDLERHIFAAAETLLAANDNTRFGVGNAIAQRHVPQSG